MKKEPVVAIVGATGAVGAEMLKTLAVRRFPLSKLIVLASKRSEGTTLFFKKKPLQVAVLNEHSFEGVDIALFSAGGSISKKYAPIAVKAGAIVIDNTSTFRMEKTVPLVVPEVNPEDIKKHKGIIANPNCSTIQMVLALKPIHDLAKIKRVVVSTYQSVSGAGQKAIHALLDESMLKLSRDKITKKLLGKQIAFNAIPQIDIFLNDGYTREENKMIFETTKILHDKTVKVTATCVRVPIIRAHSESVNIETEKSFRLSDIRDCLKKQENLIVEDNPKKKEYPTPIQAEGKFDTFVGRIRKDPTIKNGLHLWIVSDNLLKGAAFNAVQIAEHLL